MELLLHLLAPVVPMMLLLAGTILLFGAAIWLVRQGWALPMFAGALNYYGKVGSAGILVLATAIGAVIPAILIGLAKGIDRIC